MDNDMTCARIAPMASLCACWGVVASWCAAALVAQDAARARPHVDGRVVDAAGNAVARARVVLTGLAHPELPPTAAWALGDEARLRIEVTADERGVFHAELPHRGPFALLATSADGARGCRHFPVLAGDFLLTTACAPSRVDGVVSANGAPVAATVAESDYSTRGALLERYGICFAPASATADAQGRFALSMYDSDATSLAAFCKSLHAEGGEQASNGTWYRLPGQTLHGVQLDLALRPVIDSRVVAADTGQPLADAALLDLQTAAVVARADAAGRFRFVNRALDNLVVRAPGHAVRGFHAENGVCRLDAGAVVRMRLRDAQGAAARRRVVVVTRDSLEVPQHIAWTTSTDDEGVLAIDEARAGEALYAFVETADGFVACHATVPGAAARDLGDVRIDPGRTVSGVVTGADGGRCGGVTVLLQPVFDQSPTTPPGNSVLPCVLTRVTCTDHAGRFRFDLVPRGRQRLLAMASTGFQVVDVGEACDLGTIACRADGTVDGHIVADGADAADAGVQCILSSGSGAASFGMIHLFAHADGEGRFAFHGIPEGASVTIWGMRSKDGVGWMGSNAFAAPQSGVEVQLHRHEGPMSR
jgi:hypothetical protein